MTNGKQRPLGVHSLDHFTLAVPDLDAAEKFFRAFGLDVERGAARLCLRCFGSEHVWADIIREQRKKLKSVRFGIFPEDEKAFKERLGPVAADRPIRALGTSMWIKAPDGLCVEVAVSGKTSPDEKVECGLPPLYSPARGTGPRSAMGMIRPRRLAHLALFSKSVPEAISFYQEYLGLRLSDKSGDDVAFMHGPHGSEHHMVALARSAGPGLHHSSWEVRSIAEIGQGAMQMEEAGYPSGWGVGRHVLGSNYFYYARDPWGSYAEFSADMDFIAAGSGWEALDSPPEDSFYQWGPRPPEDFGTNYELA